MPKSKWIQIKKYILITESIVKVNWELFTTALLSFYGQIKFETFINYSSINIVGVQNSGMSDENY